ncbi:MAG: macro domain-containing protein [Ignavibacterium sp.]|jgi:O-acetyl-ADP-ribose deacetylase (regulator of RNase III)/uncharacterized protein YwgA
MVTVRVGDIFKSDAQTLTNTVNCVGVMGKGIALEFKKRFPDMFADYEEKCKRKEVRLGRPYLFTRLLPPWILLFPTKDHWRSVSSLSAIEEGLICLKSHYREWGIKSIAIPPLGCGLGELDWNIVGPTLYKHLRDLEISVELYAPWNTPHVQLTPEFLGDVSPAQVAESVRSKAKIEPGFITIIEVIRRIENTPYHWPIGRTTFQKIAYFGTYLGLETGLTYQRASFGPFAEGLKAKLTRLVNNGLIVEEQVGRMFVVKPGKTYIDALKVYQQDYFKDERIIERLTDLFSRIDTAQAELAATVHFARQTMRLENGNNPTEDQVLEEVLEWKKRHRPPYNRSEVAKTIRNLAILGWLDVKPSKVVSEMVNEVDVV